MLPAPDACVLLVSLNELTLAATLMSALSVPLDIISDTDIRSGGIVNAEGKAVQTIDADDIDDGACRVHEDSGAICGGAEAGFQTDDLDMGRATSDHDVAVYIAPPGVLAVMRSCDGAVPA